MPFTPSAAAQAAVLADENHARSANDPASRLLRAPVIRYLGWAATALALGFVGVQLSQAASWDLAAAHLPSLALFAALGACAYALTGFLLAEAWRQLLGATAECSPAGCYYAVYGRTQIVKYLPGNVFHFAGRQILGRQLGHEQATLALASISEVLLLLLVAATLAAPLAPRWLDPGPSMALGVAALAAAAAGMLTLRVLSGAAMTTRWRAWTVRITPLRIGRAALLYAAFFVLGGVLLWLLTLSAGGRDVGTPDLAISISMLALAWMAGFVTPGSSAGFGVREAVLIMLLQGSLDREAALLVALAMRLVTLAGDLLFFAASLALPLPRTHSEAGSTSID